jgi:hypothetical protein
MALLIEKNVKVLGNIDLSQLYLRLTISYGPDGKNIMVNVDAFDSDNSYSLNPYGNKIIINGVTQPYDFSYDRETDGSDILAYAHNKISEYLSTDITEQVAVVDPSTGQPLVDPSTGEVITEEVVTIPKFCEDSSISIINI